jgi:hypothetical protein
MSLRDRRIVAGIVAVGAGVISPPLAEEVLAHRLGLEGMPVFYGFLGFSAVGTGIAVWYRSTYSWKYLFLYGVLAFAGAFSIFIYTFGQTRA